MSYKTTDMIRCPKCQNSNNVTIWGIVNRDVNTVTTNKIMNGTFFEHKCPTCGAVYQITYPTLYEDNTHKAIICFEQTDVGLSEATSAVLERRKKLSSDQHDYQIRIVSTPNAFREKARIFDKGLDDKIIEIMKIVLLEKLHQEHDTNGINEVLCWVEDDGTFSMEMFGKKYGKVTVNQDFYNYISEKCSVFINEQDFDDVLIDLDWAINFLEKNNFICE